MIATKTGQGVEEWWRIQELFSILALLTDNATHNFFVGGQPPADLRNDNDKSRYICQPPMKQHEHEANRNISTPLWMGYQSTAGLPPSFEFANTHLYTWVKIGTVRVKCLAREHNAVTSTQTA